MQNEDMHGFKCPPDYRFDKKLMCVPKKVDIKICMFFSHFFGKSSSSGGNGRPNTKWWW